MRKRKFYIELLDKIIHIALRQLPKPQHKLAKGFVEKFYHDVDWSEYENRSPEELAGMALSLWKLFYARKSKEYTIKVFNPSQSKDGWDSEFTLILIAIDDMPFVMDTLQMQLNRLGFAINLSCGLGGIKTKRDSRAKLKQVSVSKKDGDDSTEGTIYIEIDRKLEEQKLQSLCSKLEKILREVTTVVKDHNKIIDRINDAIKDIEENSTQFNSTARDQSIAFLRWISTGNFIFLGYRKYQTLLYKKKYALKVVSHSNLGLLKGKKSKTINKNYAELPQKAQNFIFSNNPLILSKTDTISTVYKPIYTDSIIVKCYNDQGKIVGAHRFIGLYTDTLYHNNLDNIPLLKEKTERILAKFGFPRKDYTSKALFHILETLPRDDFLQASVNELHKIAGSIFKLKGRRVTRLFVYEELYGRYLSCLVYIPRDNFNTAVRMRVQKYLLRAFDGVNSSFNVLFSESILARIHFVIRLKPEFKHLIDYDVKTIEQKVIAIATSWNDELREKLFSQFAKQQSEQLILKYSQAFSAGYMENFAADYALEDIEQMEKLSTVNSLGMLFYKPSKKDNANKISLKLFHLNNNTRLTDTLPVLENFGFKVISEQSYKVVFADKIIWINDFSLEIKGGGDNVNIDPQAYALFKEAFKKIWDKELTNDSFNVLILAAKLNWREVSILRACAKYFRQIGFSFDRRYLEQVLINNCSLAKLLIDIFQIKFDPNFPNKRHDALEVKFGEFNRKLNKVKSLDEDRVLQQFLAVIKAMLRTNFYQKRYYISFKFDCRKIPRLPLPCPMFEIFTYAPNFEGVHLRMAKVARGGLRWSNRIGDYRTEILGLMKAQQVKNVVIVPYGAKGGFVLKKVDPNWNCDELQQEAVSCYKKFIRSLLDITDNIVDGKITKPDACVCYDGSDPYLVVAADKGTARFSDIANSISAEYNFWLRDAFASGGATGYDHKKIGITARGAWESVKYNFYELGIDINTEAFTVVGIGDMSGDVFGNGMLLSKNIKLVGAFNHEHIFIDPNPNAAKSFKERQRLFNFSRSSWLDYDSQVISRGGGVFNRSAKKIKLSVEIKKLLNIDTKEVSPNELIKLLLKAKVDLLWNGGIGTYVKASLENNTDVGDRDNDSVRVDASELNCKIISEGGNLGLTPLARVEYAFAGGIVNADFIDNSAGVDCSDHEVNIKILLDVLIKEKKLSGQARNKLLKKMTQEVTELVLHNNSRQVRSISLLTSDSIIYHETFAKHLDYLESIGLVNRSLEFLPNNKVLNERKSKQQGFTRSEIALLLAYSKIVVKAAILKSNIPDEKIFTKYFYKEFPQVLTKDFSFKAKKHKLYREIISTQLGNDFITDLGIVFYYEIQKEYSADLIDVIRAYVLANEIYGFSEIMAEVAKLDCKINVTLQKQIVFDLRKFMISVITWLLSNVDLHNDLYTIIVKFKTRFLAIEQISSEKYLAKKQLKAIDSKADALIKAGIPKNIVNYISNFEYKYKMLNVIKISIEHQAQILVVAQAYFALQQYLQINIVLDKIDEFVVANTWANVACAALKADINKQQNQLIIKMLDLGNSAKRGNLEVLIKKITKNHDRFFEKWQELLNYIMKHTRVEFATLYLAVHEILQLH